MEQILFDEFYQACGNGDLEKVKECIEKGVNVDYTKGDKRTGLMRSAKRGFD